MKFARFNSLKPKFAELFAPLLLNSPLPLTTIFRVRRAPPSPELLSLSPRLHTVPASSNSPRFSPVLPSVVARPLPVPRPLCDADVSGVPSSLSYATLYDSSSSSDPLPLSCIFHQNMYTRYFYRCRGTTNFRDSRTVLVLRVWQSFAMKKRRQHVHVAMLRLRLENERTGFVPIFSNCTKFDFLHVDTRFSFFTLSSETFPACTRTLRE